MSIRLKILFTITAIAVMIVIFGIGAGLMSTRDDLQRTIEKDMNVVADIADHLITTEINLLKANAATTTRYVIESSPADLEKVLREQVEAYDYILGLTVIDRDGIVKAAGIAETPEMVKKSEYLPKAFAGETVISTTRVGTDGEVVFHVYVPIDDGRVLSVTVPGLYFTSILKRFTIWQTGNIFIVDAEGTVMANIREHWVLHRFNFIKQARESREFSRIGATVREMIANKTGAGYFAVDGVERLCVYRPISGSRVGWTLGVVAPLNESPLANVNRGMLIVGAICLLLSVIAAIFATLKLEKPYLTISAMVTDLKAKSETLSAISDAAAILLRAEITNEENGNIWTCMDMIARRAHVDRMRIWKNYSENDELFCSQIYEWSEGAEPQREKKITQRVSYRRNIPGWEKELAAGRTINDVVRNFSQAERDQLLPQGIASLLVIPAFSQDKFWGFVAFDDCHKERKFSHDDENLLRSGGLLIVNAIIRNEATNELVIAREQAIASTTAKSDFLANMSHEMRTPLNAIIGLSELTLDFEDVNQAARDNLEKVYNSGVTLLSLLNDILDISKIEAGKFTLIPVEYDIPSLLNDTITLNIVRIGSKPVALNLQVDENLPSRLFGDELRVKQVFNNLLSNALKYTKIGTVDWRISYEQDGDYVWLIASVTDTGIGIKPDDLAKLFSAYNQVDTKSNRKIEGTGLGLSIAKKMVEMMDGEIKVESVYGEGSIFSVRLRQGVIKDAVPIGARVAENLRSFRYSENKRDRSAKLVRAHIPYAKVLVVDDVPTNLDVARGMMRAYGMQIDGVTSGPAAIDLIRDAKIKYNAIFMDHMMPGMDGIEATRRIRELDTDYAKNIPIIALTANALVGNEEMFLNSGFQAFLSKPIDIMRMDVVINHFVRDREVEKEIAKNKSDAEEKVASAAESAASAIKAVPEIDGIDTKKAVALFGGDAESFTNILRSYERNTPPLLDQLRRCTKEKLPEYAIAVHGLKSSSRSIGADAIGARAEELERAAKAGNFEWVNVNNLKFIETVDALLGNLSAKLQSIAAENPKPEKAAPDAETLSALRSACRKFDIDEVDRAMEELEKYHYASGGDLVEWLREQINVMGFKQVAERLA